MKKHSLITVLSAALLGLSAAAFPPAAPETPVSITAEAANGDTFNYGGYEFTHGPGYGEATLTKYIGSSPTVNVPGQVYDWSGQQLTVRRIDDYAFVTVVPPAHSGAQVGFTPMNITSATFPSTVTDIGDGVFYQCAALQSVSLPSGLTHLGDSAFYQCTNLSGIVLPSALTSIPNEAFSGCTKLTGVTVPSGVTVIGFDAFKDCTKLTGIVLPVSVTEIGCEAFKGCTKLKTVEIKGAAQIDAGAFKNCTALTNAKLNVNCIGKDDAFTGCTALTRINSMNAWTYTPSGKPVFGNGTIKTIIKRVFKQSSVIKFVDDYCTALCDYVVRTQTSYGSDNDWMCDAVKVRQLHDWLVYHYEYEDFYENGVQYDKFDPSIIGMNDNQDYCSFFVSYGVDEIDYEVGETVCAGIAKAFTMLLKAAGIESYVMDCDVENSIIGHAWNIIRIKEGDVYRYYQSDVGAGDLNYNTQIKKGIDHDGCYTNYEHFLVSAAEYDRLQGHCAISYSIVDSSNHPYFHYNNADAEAAMNQCNYNYNCNLLEGLLTGDWDFSGTLDYADVILSMYINCYYTNPHSGVSLMNAWFTDTVNSGMEPWDYIRWRIANC